MEKAAKKLPNRSVSDYTR